MLPVALIGALIVGGVIILLTTLIAFALRSNVAATIAPRAIKAVTLVNAIPYEAIKIEPLPSDRAISMRMRAPKTAQVLDLYAELANENPTDVAAFIAPSCEKLIFIGTSHIEASKTARPVWIHAAHEVFVNGDFCVSLQAPSSARVSLATNAASKYLVRVAVSDE